jgi:hypothetical protein
MDTTVLFIKPVIHDLSIEWNDTTIRNCFHEYEIHIEQIRLVPKCLHAFIHFKDYDIVDRILLQSNMFSIDGITIKMSRAKCNENNEFYIKKLLEKNQVLKKQIQRKMKEFGLFF